MTALPMAGWLGLAGMTWRARGRKKNMIQKVTKILSPDRINTREKPQASATKPPAAGPRLMPT